MFLYTKSQLKEMQTKALMELIKHCGGRKHTAAMLGISMNTVNSWVDRGTISVNGVEIVMRHPTLKDHFTADQLRPDQAQDIN